MWYLWRSSKGLFQKNEATGEECHSRDLTLGTGPGVLRGKHPVIGADPCRRKTPGREKAAVFWPGSIFPWPSLGGASLRGRPWGSTSLWQSLGGAPLCGHPWGEHLSMVIPVGSISPWPSLGVAPLHGHPWRSTSPWPSLGDTADSFIGKAQFPALGGELRTPSLWHCVVASWTLTRSGGSALQNPQTRGSQEASRGGEEEVSGVLQPRGYRYRDLSLPLLPEVGMRCWPWAPPSAVPGSPGHGRLAGLVLLTQATALLSSGSPSQRWLRTGHFQGRIVDAAVLCPEPLQHPCSLTLAAALTGHSRTPRGL
ncbi:uncharacterized protein LOC124100400 [Marmota monax]|uniref:uncharacterized protein LOC124100400 n=1 Tax=Marmota monax TaxID=9995 RepID=UPI001EB0AE33|nr:uncharacterized protein LOC124100400 [Marmota monax]